MDLSESRLRELSCDVEYVTFKHAYVPMELYQAVTIKYSDMAWTGLVDNSTVQLAPATESQSKIKRELYDEIVVEKEGEVLRGQE